MIGNISSRAVSESGSCLRLEDLKRSRLYSEDLDIQLKLRVDREYFKWFLASVLYGARISETIAQNTYRAFKRHRLLTPQAILAAGWKFLVDPIMAEGGYVRYDGRKSAQVLKDCETLVEDYRGSFTKLHEVSEDSADLERRLMNFYGVGLVTVNVFLRELRPYWKKARPEPLPIVKKLARKYNIDLFRYPQETVTFVRVEAGLIRHRKDLR